MSLFPEERLWFSGEASEAGSRVFASVPLHARAAWAGRILQFATTVVRVPSEVATLIEVARNSKRWAEAREIFFALRQSLLQDERQPGADILLLGENAAKIIFNCSLTAGQNGFNADCGGGILQCLQEILKSSTDPEIAQKAWAVIVAPPP